MSSYQSPAEHHYAPDLREYVRILRARRWEIMLITFAVVGASMFFTLRQTPVYQGTAKIVVRAVFTPGTTVQVPQAPNLDTEREIILSAAVAGRVRRSVHLTQSTSELLNQLGVQVVTNTSVLILRYSDPNPATSAKLANGFARAYVNYRNDQSLQQFQATAGAVQKRIDGIKTQYSALQQQIARTSNGSKKAALEAEQATLQAQLGVLEQHLLDIQSQASSAQAGAEVVQPAVVPTSPVSPNKIRNGILALFAGLVLAIGFAFLRERLDDRLKSREELERRFGAPVIAAVPKVGGWRRGNEAQLVMQADPRSPVSEAYRTLATNIQYMASRSSMKVLMVTSSIGGEGKTTTASNLAVALAQAGRRVLLVSADLRRPRLHRFFGLTNEIGLSDVLAGPVSLSEVVADPGVPNLRIINAGPVPPNPAELLGSARAAEFMDSLREVSEFIIIDTPPVLAVADSSAVAPLADGTLFVVDAERSRRSAMLQSRDQLRNAGAEVIGAVYNNFDPNQGSAHPYYYYSYYEQYVGPENGDAGANGKSKINIRRRRGSRPDANRSSGNGKADYPGRSRKQDPASTAGSGDARS